MDLRAALAERFLVPWYERRWGIHPGSHRRQLDASQFEPAERIRELQWERLREMLIFAHASNPFYRRRFRERGIDPRELRGLDDFAALPLLTKEDIRSHQDEMISEGYSRSGLFHKRTGGSTGVPVHLYWDEDSRRFKNAVVKRHDAWAGYRPGMRRASLWGDTNKRYPLNLRVYMALCERTIYLDTLEMDDVRLADFVERVRRFRPRVLMGHAHSIFFLAEYLVTRGIDDVSFDGVISTAETLEPAERSFIESCFGRVVFDRYGCEEVSLIASECERHEGLHTSAEGLYVEVLGGDDELPGRVVVTDLVNRGMPFIRYEVGDLATTASGQCGCGRGLPRLGRVFGRTSEILYAPDGRRISGISILDTFVIHIPGVRQAQIIQDALDHVILRVVRGEDFGPESESAIAVAVRRIFGPQMRHDLEYVPNIELSARGKYQFSRCLIDASGTPRPQVQRS